MTEQQANRRAGSRRAGGRVSDVAENYLLSLAILHEDGVAPHVSQLASYLRRIPAEEGVGATMPSVSGMVRRMARDGLLQVNRGKEIVLTPTGERLARDVVRRHRLAERLVVDILDVPIDRAEGEAHRLEHAISPALLAKIEEKLGYPDRCPYGRPIYREDEPHLRKEMPGAVKLSETAVGERCEIRQIPDEDYPLLKYMVDNGVLPGQAVTVADNAPYRGVIDLDVDGRRVSIGIEVAQRVRVAPAQG
ncbi:MAG: metal-dependent transcriptional regulator [Chloroflexota bacterium]|nr:metal-dependent transcriptional regulator [Chloroflexota bacterium]